MTRLAAAAALVLAAGLCAGIPAAGAAEMQPGLWKFTQRTSTAKGARASEKLRCITPADARDPVRYFTPRSDDGGCALVESSASMGRMSARLRCSNGSTTTEVSSLVTVESPTEITMASTVAVNASGREMTAGVKGEGRWVGACR